MTATLPSTEVAAGVTAWLSEFGAALAAGDPALLLVVLVRDANRTQPYLATAIGAGAHAIVPRAVDPRRLAEAIRRAHSDRRYIDPALAALTVTWSAWLFHSGHKLKP